jgi:Flp pilus assembly protein TadG
MNYFTYRRLFCVKRFADDRQGNFVITAALSLVLLLGVLALSIDGGRLALERNRMQNAVDTAALAAASKYHQIIVNQNEPQTAFETARSTAEQFYTANDSTASRNGARFRKIYGLVPTSSPGELASFRMRVSARVPTTFARLLGKRELETFAEACAGVDPASGKSRLQPCPTPPVSGGYQVSLCTPTRTSRVTQCAASLAACGGGNASVAGTRIRTSSDGCGSTWSAVESCSVMCPGTSSANLSACVYRMDFPDMQVWGNGSLSGAYPACIQNLWENSKKNLRTWDGDGRFGSYDNANLFYQMMLDDTFYLDLVEKITGYSYSLKQYADDSYAHHFYEIDIDGSSQFTDRFKKFSYHADWGRYNYDEELYYFSNLYFDENCNGVRSETVSTLCGVSEIQIYNSPVSLLWEPGVQVETSYTLSQFPLDPTRAGLGSGRQATCQ